MTYKRVGEKEIRRNETEYMRHPGWGITADSGSNFKVDVLVT
jgi:hypothetical protein